ncbi:MAG: hypothetical protein JXA97_05255 [Anaerolineales bacterium]|nr:hypothetical protein [Anaerolineales bacterium]
MRRGRILILFAMIVLVGAVAAYLIFSRGGGEPASEETQAPLPSDVVFVVVAAQDLSRGSEIPIDGVEIKEIPRDMVIETMIASDFTEGLLDRVIGMRARMDIARGIAVTEGMVTDQPGDLLGSGSDASLAIPPGFTAISIPLDRLSGVAYAIRDGDQVDVIATMLMIDIDPDFQSALPNESLVLVASSGVPLTAVSCESINIQPGVTECVREGSVPFGRIDLEETFEQPIYVTPNEDQRPRLVTQRLIENATILHVGTFSLDDEGADALIGPTIQEPAGAPPTTEGESAITSVVYPDIVTLIVTPQDALALNWAMMSGADLSLTLRAPGDDGSAGTSSVTLQYLVENYDITVPARLPYGLTPAIEELMAPVLPNDALPTPDVQ